MAHSGSHGDGDRVCPFQGLAAADLCRRRCRRFGSCERTGLPLGWLLVATTGGAESPQTCEVRRCFRAIGGGALAHTAGAAGSGGWLAARHAFPLSTSNVAAHRLSCRRAAWHGERCEGFGGPPMNGVVAPLVIGLASAKGVVC